MLKDEFIKVNVLRTLYDNARRYTTTELSMYFNISRKTLTTYIEQINYLLPTNWCIETTNGSGVYLASSNEASFYQVAEKLWSTTTLSTLLTLFLNHSELKPQTLADALFLSREKYQRVIVVFEKLLNHYNLQLQKKPTLKIIGNESTIRFFFYWHLVHITSGGKPGQYLTDALPQLKQVIHYIDHADLHVLPERWRVALALCINLIRNEQHMHLPEQFLSDEQKKSFVTIPYLKTFIESYYPFELHQSDIELVSVLLGEFSPSGTYVQSLELLHLATITDYLNYYTNYIQEETKAMITTTENQNLFLRYLRHAILSESIGMRPNERIFEHIPQTNFIFQLFSTMEVRFHSPLFSAYNAIKFVEISQFFFERKPKIRIGILLANSIYINTYIYQLRKHFSTEVVFQVLPSYNKLEPNNISLLLTDTYPYGIAPDLPFIITGIHVSDTLVKKIQQFINEQ